MMNPIKKYTFAFLTATAWLLLSCSDKDDACTNHLVISTINTLHQDSSDFFLTLDNGETLFPNNAQEWSTAHFTDGQRAFVLFNKLEESVAGYDHTIQVKRINEILTKDVITMNDDKDSEETAGKDKINVTYMWLNKDNKYLTIEFQYLGTHSEEHVHLLNLVVDDNPEEAAADNEASEFLSLELRHNGQGDDPQSLDEGYVSFKLNKIKDRMTGKKGIKVRVNTIYSGVKTYEVPFS